MATRNHRTEPNDSAAGAASTDRPNARRSDSPRSPASAVPSVSNSLAARTERSADQAPALGTPGTRSESMASEPSEEDMRIRAYYVFLARGGTHGRDFDDWLAAEQELRKQ